MSVIPVKETINGPKGISTEYLLQIGSMFDKIKGVEGLTVDSVVTDNFTRNNIVLNESNNIISTLFRELEKHVISLVEITAEESTSVKVKDIEADFKFDGDTEITKQLVRTDGKEGEIKVELVIEPKEPVKLKDWKGVLTDDVLVTTSLIDNTTTI